ncbi:MAG: radical SAM protein [Desulfobacteraceae bacterium]|nr:radical SAM protein [Desulfobacteraceae bacterium]
MISRTHEINSHLYRAENNLFYSDYHEDNCITGIKFLRNSNTDMYSGQCDCAIPSGEYSFKRSFNPSISNHKLYRSDETLVFVSLDNTYYAGTGKYSGFVVLNQPALSVVNYFRKPRSLKDIQNETVIQMVKHGLLIPTDCASDHDETYDNLFAWLHITDQCNLRCKYCYSSHQNKDMPLETGYSIINTLFRSAQIHGYRRIIIKYAGGEPLLRFPIIKKLHRYNTLMAEQKGVDYEGIVLTNGTLLTSKIAEKIKLYGMKLIISLDGLGIFHDSQRIYPDGKGSSKEVIRSIETALSQGIVPTVSITVNKHNADGLAELTSWILEHEIPFSFNFYRENDVSRDIKTEGEHIVQGITSAYKEIKNNLPRYTLLKSLTDGINLYTPHVSPCSTGKSYLVFDTDGNISKCQMDMAHPVTDIHSSDPLNDIRNKIGLHNPPVEEKEDCCDCKWRYWCAGGCPVQAFRCTGRYNAKSPYCDIYRTLIPEVLRLEGLRVMHGNY